VVVEPSPGVDSAIDEGLQILDPNALADDPPPESFYRHEVRLWPALRNVWRRKEVAVALAERDVRASYKQAFLGMMWALITPVLTVIIFTLIFGHVRALKVPGVPYILYSFVGIQCWGFFSGSVTAGGNSMVGNLALLQKTHFSRELFPLGQMVEQTLYTGITFIPLTILLAVNGFAPKPESIYVPLFIVIEVMFSMGVTLAIAAFIVYVRDLTQVLNIFMQFGLFATPIIWPLAKISNITWGPFHHFDFRPYYCFLDPLGPVIDNVRRTVLLGQNPDWPLLGLGALSATIYFVFGYRTFKRLEVNFADIT